MAGFGRFGSTSFGTFGSTSFGRFGETDAETEARLATQRAKKTAAKLQAHAQLVRDQASIADHVHPRTGRFTAPWKPPSGRGVAASNATRFTSESGRAAGRRTSKRKAESSRRNVRESSTARLTGDNSP